jgi:superfamily I DNA/RNA helicase
MRNRVQARCLYARDPQRRKIDNNYSLCPGQASLPLRDGVASRDLSAEGIERDGEELGDDEQNALVGAVGRSLDEIVAELAVTVNKEHDEDAEPLAIEDTIPAAEPVSTDEPSIVFTSLIGSKGLSAGYVFIVGFSNGHLPHDPHNITDHEICEFLVGLSRTRKGCHVISVNHYGGGTLDASVFARWIKPHVRKISVDKAYFERHGG